MARRRNELDQLIKRIEKLSEEEQCELLIRMRALRPTSRKGAWQRIEEIRSRLPKVSEREVKRIVDKAVREVRRELATQSRT